MSACPEISTADIAAFQRDGAICLRGLFRDWVEVIAAGIERNLQAPGPYAGNVVAAGEPYPSSRIIATGGAFPNSKRW